MPGRLRWLRGIDADELLNLYDGSEFCVYPSVYEGFGIPLVEAMRRGKAILTSTGSCFGEIAGAAAIYANPQNANEYAEKLCALALHPEQRNALSQMAQEQLKQFDRSELNRTMIGFYR